MLGSIAKGMHGTKVADPVGYAKAPPTARPRRTAARRLAPLDLLSFRWHPFAIDPSIDYSGEPTTLVVFELEGLRAYAAHDPESGFERIPLERRQKRSPVTSRVGWHRRSSSKVCRGPREGLTVRLMPRSHAAVPRYSPGQHPCSRTGRSGRASISSRAVASRGPNPSSALTQGGERSRQAITKHLHALAQAGLVRSTREG